MKKIPQPPNQGTKPPQPTLNKRVYARKLTLQLLCAVILIVVGSCLLITGFVVPPIGEIHPSVLIAFGEILTFVGSLFGLDYHYKSKLNKIT